MAFTENQDAEPLLSLHKTRLHVVLENGRYEKASELIKSESEDFLIKCFQNYEDIHRHHTSPAYTS